MANFKRDAGDKAGVMIDHHSVKRKRDLTIWLTPILVVFYFFCARVDGSSLHLFWLTIAFQILQLLVVSAICRRETEPPGLKEIIAIYLISRVFLLLSHPILEDDFYRYIWDGHVLSLGYNPYSHAPSDEFWNGISSEWRHKVNFPHVGTIYPPIAQLYFGCIYAAFGESLTGLRVGAIGLEVLCAYLIYKFLRRHGLNLKPLAAFLFFPTLMKENVNSVHFDLLAGLFFFAAFTIFSEAIVSNKSFIKGWVALALATLAKLFPMIFLPIFFVRSQVRRTWGILIFVAVVVAAYLPFAGAGLKVFGGTKAFAFNWFFFDVAPQFVQQLLEVSRDTTGISLRGVDDGRLLRVFLSMIVGCASLLLAVVFPKRLGPERRVMVLFLVVYSFSTVLNSWYWLWCLPILILYASRWVWILPVWTALGYSWFADEDLYQTLHSPVLGSIFMAIGVYFVITKTEGLERWRDSHGESSRSENLVRHKWRFAYR